MVLIESQLHSLIGGGLIGLAVTVMLLFNGRVTGISGIVSSVMSRPNKEGLWRIFFLLGLGAGGFAVWSFHPEWLTNTSDRGLISVALAGLLVGYGTVMGGGCTSGHGVCGISRLSPRSILATLTFMMFGFVTVLLIQQTFGA